VIADDRRPRFSISLAEKDLGLAMELARSVGVPSPTASMVRSMYGLAIAEGMAGEDIVALTRLYRRWSRQHDS
jgi:3-hydroxyisobutyrate dehydrogenase-like beta-hydroxyacid dehydrogenase